MSTLVLFLAAVNPAAIAASLPRAELSRGSTRVAFVVTAVAIAALAVFSEPLLDWLEVSPPTFQVAAGAVLAVAGARWIAVGAHPPVAGEDPAVLTMLLSPPLVAVAITSGTDVGAVWTTVGGIVALLVSVALVGVQDRGSRATWSWAARLVGLVGIAVALALVVDGVKTV